MTNHTALPKLAVGDKVTLVRYRRYSGQDSEIETEVTKVGRKYFWVKDAYHYQKFHLETGAEVTNYSGSCRVTTPGMRAEENRRHAAVKRLGDLGVKFDYGSRSLSTATLEAIADLVQAEGGV